MGQLSATQIHSDRRHLEEGKKARAQYPSFSGRTRQSAFRANLAFAGDGSRIALSNEGVAGFPTLASVHAPNAAAHRPVRWLGSQRPCGIHLTLRAHVSTLEHAATHWPSSMPIGKRIAS